MAGLLSGWAIHLNNPRYKILKKCRYLITPAFGPGNRTTTCTRALAQIELSEFSLTPNSFFIYWYNQSSPSAPARLNEFIRAGAFLLLISAEGGNPANTNSFSYFRASYAGTGFT